MCVGERYRDTDRDGYTAKRDELGMKKATCDRIKDRNNYQRPKRQDLLTTFFISCHPPKLIHLQVDIFLWEHFVSKIEKQNQETRLFI